MKGGYTLSENHRQLFQYCWQVLDWDVRVPRLLRALTECKADVICLQEVQFEVSEQSGFRLPAWMDPVISSGYVAILPDQKELAEMADRNLRVLQCREPVGTSPKLSSSDTAAPPYELATAVASRKLSSTDTAAPEYA